MAAATTTSKSKKKTTTRAKKISVEEAEKEKEAAIQKAKEKAIAEERERAERERISAAMNTPEDHDWEDEEDEDTPTFGTTGGAYYEDTNLPEEPDIFEFGRTMEDQGKDISYYIKKDNAFLVELYTATSLEELRKKYGGGKYTVAIKNDRGQWIKQKTMRVHGPLEPEVREEKKEQYIPPQPQMPQIDLNQAFGSMSQMFMQMQEMNQRDKSRTEREERKGGEQFNTTLFQVISEQGKSTQQMIMEMQRNNMEMLKSMNENTSRSLEKAEERNRQMIQEMRQTFNNNNKKDEFGLKEMLALIESSRNSGMDTMKTVMELSETMADMRTPDTPVETGDSKESLMSTLTKAMLPLITKAGQQSQAAPGVPQQAVQMPGLPQRRQVQQAYQQAQNPNPQTPQGHRPNGGGQVRTAQAAPSPIQGNGRYQETRVQNIQKNPLSSLGLATFSDNKGTNVSQHASQYREASPHPALGSDYESSEEFIKRTSADLVPPESDISKETIGMSDEAKEGIEGFKAIMPLVRESDVYKDASKAQQNIVELGLPIIAQYINDEKMTPEVVAHFVIDECAGQGFTPQVLAKEFTFDFLIQVASNFGIGEEKKTWFGEFYETIQDAAGDAVAGEEESAPN